MILRDPIHGLIAFEGHYERIVTSLLATREVQRLRHIRQLGLAAFSFPGAEHSRFAHALGAAHVMVRFQQRVVQASRGTDVGLDLGTQTDAVAAALLHDLGHGPFSHLFEDVVPNARRHETWTAAMIRDPDADVHQALERHSSGMAERVALLLEGQHPLAYLNHAVSGPLDVDRCDYLLRDSHMTGARYGLYDLEWLLRVLKVDVVDAKGTLGLVIEGRKGIPPVEGFFLGRNYMYQQVYHHKAVRAAEALIRSIFLRLSELIRNGDTPQQTPKALNAAVRQGEVALRDYVQLDDIQLLGALSTWQRHQDVELSELCQRFWQRRLFKTLPLDLPADRWAAALEAAQACATRHGLRPELWTWLDAPEQCAYEESEQGVLWVELRHQPLRRLGDASFVLGELRNKRTCQPRLIFPGEIRGEVEHSVSQLQG